MTESSSTLSDRRRSNGASPIDHQLEQRAKKRSRERNDRPGSPNPTKISASAPEKIGLPQISVE